MRQGLTPDSPPVDKTVYLQTYGCQMNERDSEEILGMLAAQGYAVTAREEEADVILLNTCSVREHAEARAIGKMGLLQRLKMERPQLVLGILGCMAKAQRDEIFRRLPQVDLVAGPAEIYDLPELLARVAESRQREAVTASRVLAIDRAVRPLERKPPGDFRQSRVTAFVTIMEGCDKQCAYCIVPTTRGQEVSRPIEEVVAEVDGLARAGYRQVTLLGQNVNAYGKRFPDGSGYQGPAGRRELLRLDDGAARLGDFPALLHALDARTSIDRIKFTTSHPFDAHDELFRAMGDCRAVCEFLHLPVQSGSDRLLRAMRRGYTTAGYLDKVARLRARVPEVALTTDIIVGFPGETEADFEATRALMAEVEYDSAFVFKYSPRPGTAAAGQPDDVPRAVKEARNQALLALQGAISARKLGRLVDREVEMLVEGRNRRGQLTGHTRANTTVVCDGPDDWIGELVPVRVSRATPTTLIGEGPA
jgi:tRNA-2-methylthio-N6-dimethylallyladenosine synthase